MDLLHSLFSNVWSVFLVILFFGGSIFVHELGHFLAARWRGVHVERFSIGFGPKIFSWRGRDGVEYRISWFPIGGYVALPQLADMRDIEGGSAHAIEKLAPISYLSKLIVFVAGAVFNIIFAFLLACIVWRIGQPTPSSLTTTTVAEVVRQLKNEQGQEVDSPASKAGLLAGDVILKVDGKPVQWFGEIVEQLALSSGWSAGGQRQTIFTVQRGSEVLDLAITPILSGPEKLRMVGFSPVLKMVIGKISPGSFAEKAGLQIDDEILDINSKSVLTVNQLVDALEAKGPRPITITVLRGGQKQTVATTRPESATYNADIGIGLKSGIIFTHPNPFDQISQNIVRTIQTVTALINPRSDLRIRHLTGPIGIIGGFFDLASEGLPFAIWFTIIVNVNLAIFNLLPIPVLDGGHILFATITRLRGRALPADLVATTQSIFIVLLFSMVIYVSYFDLARMFRSKSDRLDTPGTSSPAAPAKP